ncbi:MAG: hypothetical protein ABII12_10695 [Planctomycetota bacterium]
MNKDNTPDPEFVNLLEWELKSTMRRQDTLNGTSGTARPLRLRLGTTVALAVVSMLIGGAGTHAVARSIDGRSAALYIARGEAMLEIARTRLEPFARELAKMQALAEQGAVTERELRQVEAQHVHAESEIEVRELDLAETLITGKAPNDALSAPLVDGRDFVTQRMAARRRPIQRQVELASAHAQRLQEMFDTGVASARELKAAQSVVANIEGQLTGLEDRIALRASFLAGKMSATEVELRGMRQAAIATREMAARQVEVLAERHKRYANLSEQGSVSSSEFQAVDAELRTVEAHVELADLELRILDQKLKDTSEE